MMVRVASALRRSAHSEHRVPVVITPDTEDSLGVAALRAGASLTTEFPSGSSRAVIGPAVRLSKRVVRRLLRWYINPIAGQQTGFNHAVLSLAERIGAQIERLGSDLVAQRERHQDDLASVERAVDRLRADIESAVAARSDNAEQLLPSGWKALHYREFEDRHRGPRELIKKLQEPYLAHFAHCTRVLDAGGGRGEFLEIMADAGISAYAVDLDETQVAEASERGLEVYHGSVVDHLREIVPGSIDGIFSAQTVEHISGQDLLEFLDLAFRKLAPGGIIVVETPNPETLFIFSAFFYVDLTHVKPVHPEALRWAMEVTGFQDLQIQRILEVPPGHRLDELPASLASEPGWSTIATNISRLNTLLYGPQHYAAIARKPPTHADD